MLYDQKRLMADLVLSAGCGERQQHPEGQGDGAKKNYIAILVVHQSLQAG